MSCCWSTPVFEDRETPLIVDLCEVLRDKAWGSFCSTLGWCQKRILKRKDFVFEIPENYFDFEDIKQVNHKRKFKLSDEESSQGRSNNEGLMKGKIPSSRETNPETVTLDTDFSNDTAERQLYKFRFEKTRRTEIEVTFQKGFTFGGKANFSIKVPLAEIGMDAEMQYQVTKSDGQRFEESLLMEATSDIAVGPNSRYTANIQLEEKSLHTSFEITTRISMPQGRAPVYINRKSDGKKVYVYYAKNLLEIFKALELVKALEPVKDENGQKVYTKMDFLTHGIVKGVLAYNHKIALVSDEPEQVKKNAKIKYLKANAERAHERDDDDR